MHDVMRRHVAYLFSYRSALLMAKVINRNVSDYSNKIMRIQAGVLLTIFQQNVKFLNQVFLACLTRPFHIIHPNHKAWKESHPLPLAFSFLRELFR